MANGLEIIEQERRRQILEEGYTLEHDLWHTQFELARAAAGYALPDVYRLVGGATGRPYAWPINWAFKPTPKDRIHELAKAGALIVAEIERLQSG